MTYKYMVRNDTHKIKKIFENVEDVFYGIDRFTLFLNNGETATFHYKDEDGSEWYSYRIIERS